MSNRLDAERDSLARSGGGVRGVRRSTPRLDEDEFEAARKAASKEIEGLEE